MFPVFVGYGYTCRGPHVVGIYCTTFREKRSAEDFCVCKTSNGAVCAVECSYTFVHEEDCGTGASCYVAACRGHVIDDASSMSAINTFESCGFDCAAVVSCEERFETMSTA